MPKSQVAQIRTNVGRLKARRALCARLEPLEGLILCTVVPTVTYAAADVRVIEDQGSAEVTVVRSGDIDVVASLLFYETHDVTTKAGADYTPTAGLLAFSPHDSVKTFRVPVTDDATFEHDESFVVLLLSLNENDHQKTITLSARGGKLSLVKPLRLTVNGSAAGLLDLTGRPIDGDRDGKSGGDYTSLITKKGVL